MISTSRPGDPKRSGGEVGDADRIFGAHAAESLGRPTGSAPTPYLIAHMIRAIVFDFDGLILDTEEPIYRSWLEVYKAHGEELPFERWVQIVGSTTADFHPQRHLEERLGRPLPKEVLDRRVGRRTEMILAQRVLPGVVQRLDEARELGMKLGV